MSPRWFGNGPSEPESAASIHSDYPRAERIGPESFELSEFPISPRPENLSPQSILATGYRLEDNFSKLEMSEDDWIALRRYFSFVPLTSGFFSSFKWLIKKIEEIYFTKQMESSDSKLIAALAIAYARIDASTQFLHATKSSDPIDFPTNTGGYKFYEVRRGPTTKYLQRRGMRLHDHLLNKDVENEEIFRLTFLTHSDNLFIIQEIRDVLKRQWILAKLLYSDSGQFSRGISSKSVVIPTAEVRQNSEVIIKSEDYSSDLFKDFLALTANKHPDVLNAVWQTHKVNGIPFVWTPDSFYAALQLKNSEIRVQAITAVKSNPEILSKLTVPALNELLEVNGEEIVDAFAVASNLFTEKQLYGFITTWLFRFEFDELKGLNARIALEIMASKNFEAALAIICNSESKVGYYLRLWRLKFILRAIASETNYEPFASWERILRNPLLTSHFPWVQRDWDIANIPFPTREIADILLPFMKSIDEIDFSEIDSWLSSENDGAAYFVLRVLIEQNNREAFTNAISRISSSAKAESLLFTALSVVRETGKLEWISEILEALSDSKFEKVWRLHGDHIRIEILGDSLVRRHIWDNFSIFSSATISRLVALPDFGRQILSILKRNEFLTLSENQGEFLLPILEKDVATVNNLNLWGNLVIVPVQSINRWACRTIGNLGLTDKYWLQMAESGLPYPMEVCKQYLLSNEIASEEVLLEKLLMLLDSNLDSTRSLGFEVLRSSSLRVNRESLVNALAEHTDIDVITYVLDNIDALTNENSKFQFNREVFLSRRKGRRAKNMLIEKHLSHEQDSIDNGLLKRLSIGSNLRDREFALRLLALRGTDSEVIVESVWEGDSDV